MVMMIEANPDPLKDREFGHRFYHYRDEEISPLVYNRSGATCGRVSAAGYTCTRPTHPEWWRHIAANSERIVEEWGPDAEEPPSGLIDPEDGSPVDTVDSPTEVHLGQVYKLRDRENQVYVVGGADEHRRNDGVIEVLDLKKREYREVPLTELVPSSHVITLDELGFIAHHIQHVRKTVKTEAVKMMHQGKWCADGLRHALADLGLPKYEPQVTGQFTITIPFTAHNEAGSSQIRAAVRPELEKALNLAGLVATPGDEKLEIELDKGSVEYSVQNLRRR